MANGNNSKGKLIVFGIMFSYPLAGVTYQFLHYLIGLQRLGWDVYYGRLRKASTEAVPTVSSC